MKPEEGWHWGEDKRDPQADEPWSTEQGCFMAGESLSHKAHSTHAVFMS